MLYKKKKSEINWTYAQKRQRWWWQFFFAATTTIQWLSLMLMLMMMMIIVTIYGPKNRMMTTSAGWERALETPVPSFRLYFSFLFCRIGFTKKRKWWFFSINFWFHLHTIIYQTWKKNSKKIWFRSSVIWPISYKHFLIIIINTVV